jgi:hypothetical protein
MDILSLYNYCRLYKRLITSERDRPEVLLVYFSSSIFALHFFLGVFESKTLPVGEGGSNEHCLPRSMNVVAVIFIALVSMLHDA